MSAVAGWYPDPEGDTSRLRYWDGTQWTDNYTPIPTAAPAEDPQVAQLQPIPHSLPLLHRSPQTPPIRCSILSRSTP